MKKIILSLAALLAWACLLTLVVVGFSGCAKAAKPIPPLQAETGLEDTVSYPYHPDGVICYDINHSRNVIVGSGGECISILVLAYVELLENFYSGH
jgi:hypothetical protein